VRGVCCVSFVKELHQQLVTCMNHFSAELQRYESTQTEKMNSRDDTVRREMNEAQQIINDIDMLLQSREASAAVSIREMVARCEEFFKNCMDFNHDDDFSYVEFVPAGRLYVRSEHLGYLRLCDAMPDGVELRPLSGDQATCRREFTAVIKTNHSDCIDAEQHLDVQVTDDAGGPVQMTMLNNGDGSYHVVFTPTKPGMHRMNVRLFGITVSSSPLEISVANEAVLPNRVLDYSAPSAKSNGSLNTSSQYKSSSSETYFQDVPSASSAKNVVAPVVFDDSVYFAAPPPISPRSSVKASPAASSTTGSFVPVKQLTNHSAATIDYGHGDCEELRGSLMRMNVNATSSTPNRQHSWPASTDGPKVNESTLAGSRQSAAHLEYTDLSYVSFEDFDSSGLNYCNFSCLYCYWYYYCC